MQPKIRHHVIVSGQTEEIGPLSVPAYKVDEMAEVIEMGIRVGTPGRNGLPEKMGLRYGIQYVLLPDNTSLLCRLYARASGLIMSWIIARETTTTASLMLAQLIAEDVSSLYSTPSPYISLAAPYCAVSVHPAAKDHKEIFAWVKDYEQYTAAAWVYKCTP